MDPPIRSSVHSVAQSSRSSANSVACWRGSWEANAATVTDVAVALAGDDGATALIESSVPRAIVEGSNYFDPVEAFLGPMLRGRSRSARARVAGTLLARGMTPQRARVLSGARRDVRASGPRATAVTPIGFNRVLALIDELPPRPEPGVGRRGLVTALVVGVVVALSGAGAFASSRSSVSSLRLLAVKGPLPPRWELASASAREPVTTQSRSPLVQQVRDVTTKARFELTIGGGNSRFIDRRLGDFPPFAPAEPSPVERLGRRNVHIERSIPGVPFFGRWVERTPGGDVPVAIELQGFSMRDSRKVIASLSPKRDLEHDGFAILPWQRSELRSPKWSRSSTPSTQLSFRSLDYPELQVQVEVTPRHELAPIDDSFFVGRSPFATVKRRLRADLEVDETNLPWGATLTWSTRSHRVWAGVSGFGVGPPSNVATSDLEAIVRVLKFTDRPGWARSIAPLRAEMAAQPVVETVRGPHGLTYRFFNHSHEPRTIICAQLICAPMESPSDVFSADLIVDRRWWHIERYFGSPRPPRWRTSAAGASPVVTELSADDGVSWRLIDFGTKTRVARRNDDAQPIGRPVA